MSPDKDPYPARYRLDPSLLGSGERARLDHEDPMTPEQQGSSSFPSGGTPIDLRDRVPLYVDDIAPLLAAERLKTVTPRICVRVTREQYRDFGRRLAEQHPFGSAGNPWRGTVTFVVE